MFYLIKEPDNSYIIKTEFQWGEDLVCQSSRELMSFRYMDNIASYDYRGPNASVLP